MIIGLEHSFYLHSIVRQEFVNIQIITISVKCFIIYHIVDIFSFLLLPMLPLVPLYEKERWFYIIASVLAKNGSSNGETEAGSNFKPILKTKKEEKK